MLSAVLDTNVVVSAQLNEQGAPGLTLELALSRAFRLFVSEPQLEEYFAVLCRPRFGFHTRDALKLMKDIRRASTLVRPRRALSVTSDPDDNKVLECALEAGSDFVVTGNLRHFPPRLRGIRVIAPSSFLILLASEPR
jgi:uncharacterized protein